MITEEISADTNPPLEEKMAEEFLKSMVNSSTRKKILVHFKFKGSNIEIREWLTAKQYYALRTLSCLEFCDITS